MTWFTRLVLILPACWLRVLSAWFVWIIKVIRKFTSVDLLLVFIERAAAFACYNNNNNNNEVVCCKYCNKAQIYLHLFINRKVSACLLRQWDVNIANACGAFIRCDCARSGGRKNKHFSLIYRNTHSYTLLVTKILSFGFFNLWNWNLRWFLGYFRLSFDFLVFIT